MAYLRQHAGGGLSHLPQPSPRLGDYGWSVRFGPSPPGHEPITTRAIGSGTISFTVGGRPGSRTLTTAEINEIIRGNTDTDIKYLRRRRPGTYVWDLFAPSEQKHHSLRATYGQPQATALAEVIADLRAQHADILARPANPWYRIGGALHLVQDSFSPAHTERGEGDCISYLRNYGRGGLPLVGSDREHRVPADERDKIAREPGAAVKATTASRRYLEIVLKALFGSPNPLARSEAAMEFESLLRSVFRACLRT